MTIDEEKVTESTTIKIIDGIPVQKTTLKTEIIKVPQFKKIAVVDENGENVMLDEKQVMHSVPIMHLVTKPKLTTPIIEDCLSLNSDQIYAAMYGAIQLLIAKVEQLENIS